MNVQSVLQSRFKFLKIKQRCRYSSAALFIFLSILFDEEDGEFVEEVDGEGDEEEGDDVGCWGDDGGKGENDDYGVAAVAAQKAGGEQAGASQKPGHDGELEHGAHAQAEEQQGAHVGVEGDEVLNVVFDLICAQKTECERKNQKVAERYAEEEHYVAAPDYAGGGAAFGGVERGSDEAEELVDDEGGNADNAGPQGGLHVDYELACEAGVD